MLNALNMAVVENFELTSGKFHEIEICTSGHTQLEY
jgi:hypothetical protein